MATVAFDTHKIVTKEYVAEKITQQTWQLVFFMAAQAALIVALIHLFK